LADKKLTIFQGGIIFSVTEILFLSFSLLHLFDNFLISGVVGEIGIILLPSIIFILIFKVDIKKNLRIKKIGAVNSIIIIVTMLFSIPISLVTSYISVIIVNLIFKNNIIADIPIPQNFSELILSIIVIGAIAAFSEEIFFRGILFSSVEKLGVKKSFIIISVLFALFHFNFEKAIGIFILSLIICYIVYRTNSIFAGVLAHFVNNTSVVLISYISIKLLPEDINKSQSIADIVNQSTSVLIITIAILLVIAFACILVILSLLSILKSRTEETKIQYKVQSIINKKEFMSYIPGLLIMAGVYIHLILKYIGN